MTTAVAKAKNTAVSTDLMDDMMLDAGEGAAFSADEMQIPFVRLLQALSPQLNKKKPEYIDGASSGDAFNNVTGQYWNGETGIKVVPCFQTTKYLEFTPREAGGGFRGEIPASSPLLQQTSRSGSKEILPNGNELVKSDQHFCLIVDEDGSSQPAVIDMKSTQLKVSRRWKTQIAMQKVTAPDGRKVTPPLYATIWTLRSVEESNDQGDWANWVVEREGLIEDRELYQEAKTFRQSIEAGEVKAAAEESPQSDSSNDPYPGDDIPF
jgi:hypothetical protein